jgi:hypothetical protein
MSPSSPQMQSCINECLSCHRLCLETAARSLEEGGPHAAPKPITTLLDCADICQTSAAFMLRGSALHRLTCATCAEVCDACAEECARFNHAFLQRCAEACRRCADSCREMAGARHAA